MEQNGLDFAKTVKATLLFQRSPGHGGTDFHPSVKDGGDLEAYDAQGREGDVQQVLQVCALYGYRATSSLPSRGFTHVSWAAGNAPSQLNLYSEMCWEASPKHHCWKPALRLGKLLLGSHMVLLLRPQASKECLCYDISTIISTLVLAIPGDRGFHPVSQETALFQISRLCLILSNAFGFSPFPLVKHFAPFYLCTRCT